MDLQSGLQEQIQLKIELLSELRKAEAITNDPDRKFELNKRIEKLENEVTELNKKLNSKTIKSNSTKEEKTDFISKKFPKFWIGLAVFASTIIIITILLRTNNTSENQDNGINSHTLDSKLLVIGLPFCTEDKSEKKDDFFHLNHIIYIYSVLEILDVLNVVNQYQILDKMGASQSNYSIFCKKHSPLRFARDFDAHYMISGNFDFSGDSIITVGCDFISVTEGNCIEHFDMKESHDKPQLLHKKVALEILALFGITLNKYHKEILDAYTIKVTNNPAAYKKYIKAWYHIQNKNYTDAEKYAKEGLKLDENSMQINFVLSQSLLKQEKYEEAKKYIKKAEQLLVNEPNEIQDTLEKDIKEWKVLYKLDDIKILPNIIISNNIPHLRQDIFYEGLTREKRNSKWGFIDKNGKIVINREYDTVRNFSQGVAIVGKYEGNRIMWSIINKTGAKPYYSYSYIGDFTEGYAKIKIVDDGSTNVWGFIDIKGNHVGKFYQKVYDFSEGMALVNNGKYGYIDTAGIEKIPLEFSFAGTFKDGYAMVQKNGQLYYINHKGECIKNCP